MVENITSGLGEEQLVRRAVRGDAEAFSALYLLHLDPIYRYIYYRIGDALEAEDLTENVFLKAWGGIDTYEQQGLSLCAWLYRIAHNVVVDHYRTNREGLSLDGELATLAEESLGPEEMVLKIEEIGELGRAISRLPEEQQHVLVLRFIEQLTHAQVGEILGKSETACRVLQHRALIALKRILGRGK